MKKIILFLLMALVFAVPALAVTSDYFVHSLINLSQHVSDPQALELLPGGFVLVDREGISSMIIPLDGQGGLANKTGTFTSKFNITNISSGRVEGIRVFNLTGNTTNYAILDNSNNKKIILINASFSNTTGFERYNFEWTALSPLNFSSSDDLVGFCTNKSFFWVALRDRDVVNTLAGLNSSVNQSGEYSIPGTNSAGALDCFNGNTSQLFILDEEESFLHVTLNASQVVDSINLSNITGQAINSFSDIAVESASSFYALNNVSGIIYLIRSRARSVLDIEKSNLSFSYPSDQQTFKSRFSSILTQLNFSAAHINKTTAGVINCTLRVNNTDNVSIFAVNNFSINNSFNVTFSTDTDYKVDIACLSNESNSKESFTGFKTLKFLTYRHVFWMGDNFSLWYNDDDKRFEAQIGYNQTLLTADFNLTTDDPVSLKLLWDNTTTNRTLYIDGIFKASDLGYHSTRRIDRIYLGSRNDTGQLDGLISFLQTDNKANPPLFKKGSFIDAWKTDYKDLEGFFKPSYFFQFKASLIRDISIDQPVLRFVNLSFDDTLMNFSIEPDIKVLDFSFSSSSSSATPSGQTDAVPVFSIYNIGNKSFSLTAKSLTDFDSCFRASLFNSSVNLSTTGVNASPMNLSTQPQNFSGTLGAGQSTSVWINVTATSCSPSSEFFDIEFETDP